jgi:hypothetical protein
MEADEIQWIQGGKAGLLPQSKMLPGRIVGAGAFDEGVENSIKFILHGFS